MPLFQDDGFEMKHTDEYIAKRKRTFILLEIFQILCPIAIIISLLINKGSALLVSFISAPIFILLHITYIKGISSLKDDGENTKQKQIIRFLVLTIYLIVFIIGAFASQM